MKKIIAILTVTVFSLQANAQDPSNVWLGEFGVSFGMGHYFGDLNTRSKLNRPKPTVGLFFKKQFNDHVGVRLAGKWVSLGYSDIYSENTYQHTRNLSFNSNVWEVGLQGDFYFFKFDPNSADYVFTPYITLGVAGFSYDPYAYLQNEKYFLRPLGTEGQQVGYEGRKQYGTVSWAVPFGFGLKYNLTPKVNMHVEVVHRFTGTDYLDDVSKTYAGADKFMAGSAASLLQDRSYEYDTHNVLGIEGAQRGWSKQKDQYATLELGFSINLNTYRCPKP